MTVERTPTPPWADALGLNGPLQPQLVLLLDSLSKDEDAESIDARRALARRVHAALRRSHEECLAQLAATITEADRALLLALADRHEQRTPAAAAGDPRERLRRLEPARRYRDGAQILGMLAELGAVKVGQSTDV